jgi:hypothetical protein
MGMTGLLQTQYWVTRLMTVLVVAVVQSRKMGGLVAGLAWAAGIMAEEGALAQAAGVA